MQKFTTMMGAATLLSFASLANAGPIFLTGHDPDYHAHIGAGAGQTLLQTGLDYVTSGQTSDTTKKFLWVESRISTPGGHLTGEDSLGVLGLTLGVHYDRANGSELAGVDLSIYEAIAIASSFGGKLTRAELDALIARSTDITNFINAGGGLFASSECYPCGANLLAGSTTPALFGYLPIIVTSIGAAPPFNVTPFGTSLGLDNGDVNDPTHNSFGVTGGLNVVDTDAAGNATTLAGNVKVGSGGFTPVPEPASFGLMGLGLVAMSWLRRRMA